MEMDRQRETQKRELEKMANLQKIQIQRYQAAFKSWQAKTEAGEEAGTEPNFDDFVKPPEETDSGVPKTISTKAEFDALADGEEYISAKTGRRARK
jgi:hypothetical protein